jgi:glycosyltransferase involved in cell wall biosynthesis
VLVRATGGGTETNVRKLVAAVPEFEMLALEEVMGFPLRWGSLASAIRALRARRPEVVFCYGVTAHAIAAAAWPVGMPLVGNIRCESDFAGAKGVLRTFLKPRFRFWISNSRMALRGEEGLVIHNGIQSPPDETPLLPDLPGPVLGILARGHPKKRHRFALELWEQLGKPGSLVFAGELPEDLRRDATQAGVICPGFVKAGPLLRSLDMLLMPSDAEGIPTAMLEAMVRGVPCLSTDAGGIRELVTHGETGIILPREQWEDYLRSADWKLLRRIGDQGRRHVLENFAFDRMRRQFEDAARRAAGRA